MSTPIDSTNNRIRDHRQRKGWSLQRLADEVGTSKSQIDKLEKGERRLTVEWMVRLARRLDCDPRALLSPDCLPKGAGVLLMTPTIPLYTLQKSKKTKAFELVEDPEKVTARPPFLAQAPEAYALRLPKTPITPLFRPNQILYIAPHTTARRNQPVLILPPAPQSILPAPTPLPHHPIVGSWEGA